MFWQCGLSKIPDTPQLLRLVESTHLDPARPSKFGSKTAHSDASWLVEAMSLETRGYSANLSFPSRLHFSDLACQPMSRGPSWQLFYHQTLMYCGLCWVMMYWSCQPALKRCLIFLLYLRTVRTSIDCFWQSVRQNLQKMTSQKIRYCVTHPI